LHQKGPEPHVSDSPPLHHVCDPSEAPKITIIDYDESYYHEAEVKAVEECFAFKAKPTTTWINIDCMHSIDLLTKLGACYGFHPLVLEDILSDQRPKLENYDEYIFIVLKMIYYDENSDGGAMEADQISIILGPNYVISLKEKAGDVFNPLRDRLRTGKGRIRKLGADYLAYSMIDAIVDNYFIIMERLGDRFEDVEDAVVTKPEPDVLLDIYNLRQDTLSLRRSVWPVREAIAGMERTDSPLITEVTKIYLRDVYDHTIQVIENIENLRDTSASLLDIYLSSLSNRLNEVIKVLTVISTIFIPLTFLSGLFGMNVQGMVEWLRVPWAFYAIAATMLAVALVMVAYFRKKRWF
jgi:magnesium transporter